MDGQAGDDPRALAAEAAAAGADIKTEKVKSSFINIGNSILFSFHQVNSTGQGRTSCQGCKGHSYQARATPDGSRLEV